jgi:hypothetical protein
MRALTYVLNDGTEVKTLNEAQTSGQKYKTVLRECEPPKYDLEEVEENPDD